MLTRGEEDIDTCYMKVNKCGFIFGEVYYLVNEFKIRFINIINLKQTTIK